MEGVRAPSSRQPKKWSHEEPSINVLVDNGFYFTPAKSHPHQVTCFWCGKKENDIVNVKNLASHHLRSSPHCSYALIQANMENYVLDNDKETFWQRLAQIDDVPKSVTDPHSTESIKLRRSTFREYWSLDSIEGASATSENLAAAGLYYSPLFPGNDRLLCMYCDCPLEYWEANDDPLIEHKKNSYAYCYFLETLEKKSNEFRTASPKKKEEVTGKLKTSPNVVNAGEELDFVSADEESSKAPSPSASPKLTPHQASEFDAYDFSIEDIKGTDDGTIFNKSINESSSRRKQPSRALKAKTAPKPKVEPKKSNNSLIIEVRKEPQEPLRYDDEHDNIPSSRLLLQALGEDVTNDSIASQESFLQHHESGLLDDVITTQNTATTDGDWEGSGDDLYRESSSQEPTKSKKLNQKKRKISDEESPKRNTTDTSDFGMDSDRFREIINSPRKSKNMKKLIPNDPPESPSTGFFDLSGRNIGDYDESDVSFLEKEGRSELNKNGKAKQALALDKSQKSRKSAFDDDDDDFNFFSFRQTKKQKLPPIPTNNEPDLLTDMSKKDDSHGGSLADISASTDVRIDHSKDTKGKETLNLDGAERLSNEEQKGEQNVEQKPTQTIPETVSVSLPAKKSHLSSEGDDVDSLANDTVASTSSPQKKPVLNDNKNAGQIPDSTPPSLHTEIKSYEDGHAEADAGPNKSSDDGGNGIGAPESPVRGQEAQNDRHALPEENEKLSEKKFQQENHLDNLTLSPENGHVILEETGTRAENGTNSPVKRTDQQESDEYMEQDGEKKVYADTKQEEKHDGSAADVDLPVVLYKEKEDSPIKEAEDSYQLTLSPSSYMEYMKDLRSMDEEFIDASDVAGAGTLQIEQASKHHEGRTHHSLLPQKRMLEDSEIDLFDHLSPVKAAVIASPLRITYRPQSEEKSEPEPTEPEEKQLEEKQQRLELEDTDQVQKRLEYHERTESEQEDLIGNGGSWSASKESEEFFDTIAEDTIEVKYPNGLNKPETKAGSSLHSLSHIEDSHSELPLLLLAPPQFTRRTPRYKEFSSEVTGAEGDLRVEKASIDEGEVILSPQSSPKKEASTDTHVGSKIEEKEHSSVGEQSLSLPNKQVEDDSINNDHSTRFSGSFANVESSTPQKDVKRPTHENREESFGHGDREESFGHGEKASKESSYGVAHITEELKTLSDTMKYLTEVMSSNCELYNDTEGTLTDFVAAMPEEEEAMTIKEWMQHNARTCGRTVREVAERYIQAYEEKFELLISRVERMPTN